MTRLSIAGDAMRAIDAAPEGPSTIAFFDVEGTLTAERGRPASVVAAAVADRAGTPATTVSEEGHTAFRMVGAASLRYEAWQLVHAHHRRGHLVVALSSETPDRAQPVADELAVEHLVCTQPEVADGVLTGRLVSEPLEGPRKLTGAASFAAERGVELRACFAYADGGDDLPLLEAAGRATVLGADPALTRTAAERGWTQVEVFDRAVHRADVARTAGAYGGFLTATGVGLVTGLRHRRRRPGVDAMTRAFGRIGPLLSGIDVRVQGAEHARSSRPAVFIINHQSHLVDAIVSFGVLRDGFTVVAKREVRSIPVLGQATWLADWAYVDRVGDRSQARGAISDAVDKLRSGVSVILAPEGTRSVGPMPGPFKKGAFFMAREAGVPVIPVVMRNTGELMWRNSRTLKPGTVDVVVHPPVSCDWSDEEFRERVADVRRLFVDTLEHWPDEAENKWERAW